VEIVRDFSADARATGGFVDLRRVELVARYPDGKTSDPFRYDAATRKGIDAVVILAFRRVQGRVPGADERHVFLRSAVRPPIALRDGMTVSDWNLWELPAGIVDPGEVPRGAAARELEEELGFAIDASRLVELGSWTWPAPGVIAEKHFYFAVDITSDAATVPTEDGSPLERCASILTLPLGDLLDRCRRGELPDAKTELALRRFAEMP
jgi:ADP-ribose pyrophosphatase